MVLENKEGNYLIGYFTIFKERKIIKSRIVENIFFVFNLESKSNNRSKKEVIKNSGLCNENDIYNNANCSQTNSVGFVKHLPKN